MAITRKASNRVIISGPYTEENRYHTSEIIRPGSLIVSHLDTTLKWKKSDAEDEQAQIIVAMTQSEMNRGLTDDYASGDLMKAAILQRGAQFNGLVESGANIAEAGALEDAGNGSLKAADATTAGANVFRFKAVTGTGGAVTVQTRLIVEVL